MGLLFLLALLLAWPTFGISLLAWIALAIFKAQNGGGAAQGAASGAQRGGGGFVERGALAVSADLIAQKATSTEAFSGGIGTAFSSADAVEGFFRKYGSTERKFDFHPSPPFYIGYVKVPSRAEFLSVVLMQDRGSVIASFEPDMQQGQDFLGLMGKKMFADEVASQFLQANLVESKSGDNYMFWEKKDHSDTIEKIVLEIRANGQETAVLPFLSLGEAAEYAKDKSPLMSPGFVQCHQVIQGGYYNIEFKPHPNKGVYMSAYWYYDV